MRSFLILFLLSLSVFASAQQYSRVKIFLDKEHSLQGLTQLGLDTDHGQHQPQKYFTGEFSQEELSLIRSHGFATEILIEDLEAYLHELNESGITPERSQPFCDDEYLPTQYQTPANYTFGSMGGYFTYQEMLDILDDMATQYPAIFKARQPITTAYSTHEGRPVFWVKISDNPDVNETGEPEILYTGVHHAREPNSLSQMVFYMWYLLENYDTDEEVKYLVDNVEMYFVPCLNPDGYIYNETTNPAGGGFWRKNMRDNGDGTTGVDLNRNYGYEWGYNNIGSSPSTGSATYRGPGPFSEPETQMIKEFCESHQFQIALNYHTYGNLLIYPFGYTDSETPDHPTFSQFSSWLNRDNNYLSGFGSQTVGYNVNGSSDDWMYGEMTTKGKIFSFTPEVGPGTYGFWPPQSAIDGLNKECMTLNLTAAHLPLNYGILTPYGDRFISTQTGVVFFSLKKLGLAPGALTVSLEPLTENVATVGSATSYGMFHLEELAGQIPFSLKSDIQEGDTIRFNIVLDNGLYQNRHPVERIYTLGAATAFFDDGSQLDNWSATGGWDVTNEYFYSAPTSLTDSPGLNYGPNTISEIVTQQTVKLNSVDVNHVYLTYWTKWDIEENEDYAQVLVSVNGSAFVPLCGKYTEAGKIQQAFDEPVYDGTQPVWVKEEIDLTDWLNLDDSVAFNFAFRLFSDEAVEADGFYFDDLEIVIVGEPTVSSVHFTDVSDFKLSTRPNPARDFVIIDLAGETKNRGSLNLQVFNPLGQLVCSRTVQGQTIKLDTGGWLPGIYQYRLGVNGGWLPSGRFMIGR